MKIDINDIDFDRLRDDLKRYFGTAQYYFPLAMADLVQVDSCSNIELLELIGNTNLNIMDYMKNKSL